MKKLPGWVTSLSTCDYEVIMWADAQGRWCTESGLIKVVQILVNKAHEEKMVIICRCLDLATVYCR